jgi:hypothetical protein
VISIGPEQARMIEKWRLRHANPDALGLWAISTVPEACAFAFIAIAQDPLVLRRAARQQASRLAAQAEEFALSLADSDAAKSDTWAAAALFVQQSADAWRASLKAYSPRSGTMGVSIRPPTARTRLGDPWVIAGQNFPHVDDATGMLATRILREFGGAVLARVRKPWDHVITLGVLRYASRLLRGDVAKHVTGFTWDDAVADILTVQSYAEESGLSPMLVGYFGPGRPAMQALGLLRDARTLRDAVRAADGGGKVHALLWQCAIDFHAFAVVALDHRILLDLPLDDAYEIAAAAIRQADAATRTRGLTTLPRLPPECASEPEVVKLHARACLPDKGVEALGDQLVAMSDAR